MADELTQDASEATAKRKPVEVWAAEKATPPWLFAATRAYYLWPIGRELTEAEFLKAVDATANIPIGYHLEHPKKQ